MGPALWQTGRRATKQNIRLSSGWLSLLAALAERAPWRRPPARLRELTHAGDRCWRVAQNNTRLDLK
jgi:hypothetical protein